jgi:hypothetical protein
VARFTSELDETFHSQASVERLRDHFADLDAIIANYGHLERAERLGDRTVRFTLPPKNHGVTQFDGCYTCEWTHVDASTIRWKTIGTDNNMWSDGEATFTTQGGRTAMRYRHTIAIELSVNRMLAKMVGGVVSEVTRRELRAYVKRMLAVV